MARQALAAGADLINDVSALSDPLLGRAVAEAGCPLVLMHSRGDLATMQRGIHFEDLLGEVRAELADAARRAVEAGVDAAQIVLDPGVGFGKTGEQNLTLIRRLDELAALGRPLLLGASRKSFIAAAAARPGEAAAPPDRRLGGSLAAVAWAVAQGAAIVRVHDVAETAQFLDVWRAVGAAGGRRLNVLRFLEILTWRDAVDVLAVAIIIYNLLLLIRGTRAVQILLGLVFLGVVYYTAILAELPTLQRILESLLIVLPFAMIVLFQGEIRRALADFGRNPLWGLTKQQQVVASFSEIVLAATTLSARRIGALIVIERLHGLRNYIENGIALDAVASYDLLINLFQPDTPLHDGAVIIQDDRIAAAGCFLPLTPNPELSKEFGTRHRAAIGLTEETDAVAVVVSEETGVISVVFDGEMERDLDSNSLRNALYKYLVTDLYPQGGRA